jgi:hypothetical protein
MLRALQVGAHYVKDLFAMLVVNPLQDQAVSGVAEATGLDGVLGSATNVTNDAIYYTHMGKRMQHQFQNLQNFY